MQTQLILLGIILLLAGAAALYFKFPHIFSRKNLEEENISEKTAQEFVNARDLGENCMYTIDGGIFVAIKIEGLCLELYNNGEQYSISKQLSAGLSKVKYPFKYLSVSRPIDISKAMDDYANLYDQAIGGKREILKEEMIEINEMVMSGETLERQHYIIVWNYGAEAENDVIRKAREIAKVFNDAGINADIIDKNGITKLTNLVNIPAYVHLEYTSDIQTTISVLKGVTV